MSYQSVRDLPNRKVKTHSNTNTVADQEGDDAAVVLGSLFGEESLGAAVTRQQIV